MSDTFGKSESKRGMRLTWRGVVIIVIAVVLLVFAVQNLEPAQVKFLGMDFDIYVWLIVPHQSFLFILCFVVGRFVSGHLRRIIY